MYHYFDHNLNSFLNIHELNIIKLSLIIIINLSVTNAKVTMFLKLKS